MKPVFFATPEEFGAWLEEHHETATEVVVGFYKKASGKPSITWPEAVEQALRFGWIDGVRRSLDDESYTNRFTPRKRGSSWSAVNIKRAGVLVEAGRMHAAGLAAYEGRDRAKEPQYSYEDRGRGLGADEERAFVEHPAARASFQAQPPGYRRAAGHWVMSAKREETRRRRLATLIENSAQGRRIAPLARPAKG